MRNPIYLIIIGLLTVWGGVATWKLYKTPAYADYEQPMPLVESESGMLTFSEKITSITVESDSGSVQIIGKEEVGTTDVGIKKAGYAAIDCVIDTKVEDGVLKIKSKIKQNSNTKVDFKINVPKNVSVNAHIGAGGFAVRNIMGDAKIDVGAGGIDAEDLFGEITVSTGAGDIGLKYSKLPSKTNTIHAQIGSGGLDVSFPQGAKIQYDVSSMMTNSKLDCVGTPDFIIDGSIGRGGFRVKN